MASSAPSHDAPEQAPVTAPIPRITIQFCTQCKWMLRAAYYAQELLSTFSLSIGEVALQPSTGGTFIVTIYYPSNTTGSSASGAAAAAAAIQSTVLWDRKTDGGFPETKDLKRRVRDVIDPGRHLGHVDRDHHPRSSPSSSTAATAAGSGAASPAPAATSAPAAPGMQETTQEASTPASSPTATKEGNTGQDEDAQKQASAGIVCEDCA